MPKMDTKPAAAEPVTRAGTTEVDLSVLGALRDWRIAADEYRAAGRKLEAARAALDAAGTFQAATFQGRPAFNYRPGSRRSIDLDRLAERWAEAFEDCSRESPTSTLVVDREVDALLRQRNWRAAVRKRG